MGWFEGYATLAALVAIVALVGAGWFRDAHIGAPDRPGVAAVLAGLLWPIVLVGMVELVAVIGLRIGLRSHTRPVPRHSVELRVLSTSG